MTHSNSKKADQPGETPLDTKVLDAIGRALKAHYDDLVKAPLPERFLDLLDSLEIEERKSKGDADAAG
ncbi:NepR family anti-sigma factor [Roseiarcus sp.]|jgi:hypothetical protein|uniref:NepR family anti-sigma factor n=1 Tax=Roseiarcus sp. TaxID=1969460 RepID=UPI003F9D3E60